MLAEMDAKVRKALDLILDDVIDVLEESGWADEAEWYGDLRTVLLESEPGSPPFTEALVELEHSFLGLGSFTDIPLDPKLLEVTEELSKAAAIDTHHQRLGLVSCASGIIGQIKKSLD